MKSKSTHRVEEGYSDALGGVSQQMGCFFPASFCLFLFFSHYNFNNTNRKKHRWCAWDLNPGWQDGRSRRIL